MPEDSKLMILAPVIRDRKGEHLQVIDTMRSQGFIRLPGGRPCLRYR